MRSLTFVSTILVFSALYHFTANALNFVGPRVYVVTPSSRSAKNDEGRSAPFYYHNWMRRIDSEKNETTTVPPKTTPKVKTPDLIFAEFESESNSNMKNSIRKLLEKEKVESKTTTTLEPIYVPDEINEATPKSNYDLFQSLQVQQNKYAKESPGNDYFVMHNQRSVSSSFPIYIPPTTEPTATELTPSNVQNIWHVIDNEKYNQDSGHWQEVSVGANEDNGSNYVVKPVTDDNEENKEDDKDDATLYDNLALPGFATSSGNGAENESRAIRTEQNVRFPYINLKPFQVKMKKPMLNDLSNSKKGNNLFSNLNNFYNLKDPVRGEAQDVVAVKQHIDRYNPAQPYLPQNNYGSNSKQSDPASIPAKATASLVPPPPPLPPKLTDNDFPAPTNYESFPPYPPSIPASMPAPPLGPKPTVAIYSPQSDPSSAANSDSNDGENDGPLMILGYDHKQQSSFPHFEPTISPPEKPLQGYNYNKPTIPPEAPPMNIGSKPSFTGYHYDKPPSQDIPKPSYGNDDFPNHHDTDYPELIFQKHHGEDESNNNDDMKGNSMGMMPPPVDMKPDMHGPPIDDSGFPNDFPGDLKYHHDFDDHDFHHYHHHTTTTTTTTEMPRVNRYSYYYLGKKLYYLPLYFSVYFIVYVGALIIKAVLRHKIVYPNSWRPNDQTASFFSKRSIDSWDLNNENLHEITGKVTHALTTAAKLYINGKKKNA